jgi:HEAT repeat protein
MSRFISRWLACALLLGLTGCGLIDPVGSAIKKLSDPTAAVRLAAIEKLRSRHDARAVEPLIACLADQDPDVRKAATDALGELNDPRAIEPLIACLNSDYTEVSQATIAALAKFDHAQVGDRLLAHLQNKNADPAMTAVVIGALGTLHYSPAVGALIPFLASETDEISNGTVDALGQIGAPAVEPLIAALKDPKAHSRERAAETLGRIGDARAIAPLIAHMVELSGKDPTDEENSAGVNVHDSLCEALAALGKPVIKPLTEYLKDKNVHVQEDAAVILDKLHWLPPDTKGKAAFFVLLQSWDQLVALGAPAVGPLLGCLKDEDYNRRQGAAQALGELGDKRAVDPLIACLQDDNAEVKKIATNALGQLGDNRAVAPLIDVLKTDSTEVGLAAAEALGELGDSAAVPPLVASLTDQDAGLRQACAQALDKLHYQPGKIEDNITYLIALQAWDKVAKMGAPAFEPLVACLSDQNRDVHESAIGALGDLGDKRAISPLSDALPDWNLNGALVSALEKLGWKPASDAEQIYDWIGKQDTNHLKQAWGKTSKVLLDDVSSGDQRKVENAVYSFVALGDPKVVDDLVQALDDHGDKDMAETFLNSGNEKLEQAAHDWASSNGYQTITLPADSTPMHWGSW